MPEPPFGWSLCHFWPATTWGLRPVKNRLPPSSLHAPFNVVIAEELYIILHVLLIVVHHARVSTGTGTLFILDDLGETFFVSDNLLSKARLCKCCSMSCSVPLDFIADRFLYCSNVVHTNTWVWLFGSNDAFGSSDSGEEPETLIDEGSRVGKLVFVDNIWTWGREILILSGLWESNTKPRGRSTFGFYDKKTSSTSEWGILTYKSSHPRIFNMASLWDLVLPVISSKHFSQPWVLVLLLTDSFLLCRSRGIISKVGSYSWCWQRPNPWTNV